MPSVLRVYFIILASRISDNFLKLVEVCMHL